MKAGGPKPESGSLQRLAPRSGPLVLWLVSGLLVTLLCLRFGMRGIGVRDDRPLPHVVYSLTAPLVEPFYRFFPESDRFDYHVIELAALAAAGAVVAVTLVVYVVGLVVFSKDRGG